MSLGIADTPGVMTPGRGSRFPASCEGTGLQTPGRPLPLAPAGCAFPASYDGGHMNRRVLTPWPGVGSAFPASYGGDHPGERFVTPLAPAGSAFPASYEGAAPGAHNRHPVQRVARVSIPAGSAFPASYGGQLAQTRVMTHRPPAGSPLGALEGRSMGGRYTLALSPGGCEGSGSALLAHGRALLAIHTPGASGHSWRDSLRAKKRDDRGPRSPDALGRFSLIASS